MTPALADFAGHWRLVRRIEDRQAGQDGVFDGLAAFLPDGTVLRYTEDGRLKLGGNAPLEARRAYVWRMEAGQIVVDHADGRAFHAFDPAAPVARHDCPPDTYLVRYDFTAWPVWSAEWTVSGPRKDYTSVSTYSRLPRRAG